MIRGLVSGLALGLCAGAAQATVLTLTDTFNQPVSTLTSVTGQRNGNLPAGVRTAHGEYRLGRFDPGLGELQSVTLTVRQTATPRGFLSYTCADPNVPCTGTGLVSVSHAWALALPGGQEVRTSTARSLAVTCQLPVPAGACGANALGPPSLLNDTLVLTAPLDLAFFIGAGTFAIDRNATVLAGGTAVATSFISVFAEAAPWSGLAAVSYSYTPLTVAEPAAMMLFALASLPVVAFSRRCTGRR